MKDISTRLKSRRTLIALLVVQFATNVFLLSDIQIGRQIVGFLFFSFIPGFIFLKLINLRELDALETVVLSVGLSVAFLMLAGLLINEFGLFLGFSQPLSFLPLMIVLNGLILAAVFFVHLRKDVAKFSEIRVPRVSPQALLLLCFPAVSILGVIWVNVLGNNVILMFMIMLVAIFVVFSVASEKVLPSRLYPYALFMIAISLLFHSSLISNYIVTFGSDVHLEHYVFKTTQEFGNWSSANQFFGDLGYQRINSMLSVTILPTIYSDLLNIDAAWVFKILFPLIFSFVPLVLYQVWQSYVGKKLAFISAFLFLAQNTFYTEMLGLNRQIIGELFFVLSMLTIFSNQIKGRNKILLFTIFGFALVVSHYALAEIFLFFASFTLISLFALRRPSRNITLSMIVLFFVVMFSWYMYTSHAAVFNSFITYGDYVSGQMGDFFNPASRGETVLRGIGLEAPPSVWNTISRIFAYLTQGLIVVGLVGLVTRRTKIHIDREYLTATVVAVAFLAALIIVPGLANTMNMTRFYHILLFFLAPLCAIGGKVIAGLIPRRQEETKASILLLIVIVPYFLFQVGFVYEVAGAPESWSLPLSMQRMNAYQLHRMLGYVNTQDVVSAEWWLDDLLRRENMTLKEYLWMSQNVTERQNFTSEEVYSDVSSSINVLISYRLLYQGYVNVLSNTSVIAPDGTIYLCSLNIQSGIAIAPNGAFIQCPLDVSSGIVVGEYRPLTRYIWNTTELDPILANTNKVYTNGASEIHRGTQG